MAAETVAGCGGNAVAMNAAFRYRSRIMHGASLAIGEIGYLLGCSEPSAFHRAVPRWHGTTPAAFRARMRLS